MRNISLTQQYKQAVTDWNAKQQITLFGTCLRLLTKYEIATHHIHFEK